MAGLSEFFSCHHTSLTWTRKSSSDLLQASGSALSTVPVNISFAKLLVTKTTMLGRYSAISALSVRIAKSFWSATRSSDGLFSFVPILHRLLHARFERSVQPKTPLDCLPKDQNPPRIPSKQPSQ